MGELVPVWDEFMHHKAVLHSQVPLSRGKWGVTSVALYPGSAEKAELQYMNLHEESFFIEHECLRWKIKTLCTQRELSFFKIILLECEFLGSDKFMNVIRHWPVTCIYCSTPIYSKEGTMVSQTFLNLHFTYSLRTAAKAEKSDTLKYTPRTYSSGEIIQEPYPGQEKDCFWEPKSRSQELAWAKKRNWEWSLEVWWSRGGASERLSRLPGGGAAWAGPL